MKTIKINSRKIKTIEINSREEASRFNNECWIRTDANVTGCTYMPIKEEFDLFFKRNNIEIDVNEIVSCSMVSQLLECEVSTKNETYKLVF